MRRDGAGVEGLMGLDILGIVFHHFRLFYLSVFSSEFFSKLNDKYQISINLQRHTILHHFYNHICLKVILRTLSDSREGLFCAANQK